MPIGLHAATMRSEYAPVFEVSAISHRTNPIFQTIVPASLEHRNLGGSLPREPVLYKFVKHVAPGVRNVHLPPYASGFMAVISLKPEHRGQPKNVALAATLGGATRREARDRAEALLQRVGLGHRRTARPGTLSVGEQQRVGIARALVSGPAVVLADEPTASLDERRTDEVLDLLDEVVEEAGATLLLVTHEPRVRDRFQTVLSLDEGPLRGAPS